MVRTLAVVLALSFLAAPAATTGPNSSQSPYLVPVADGVEFTSVLTVGDTVPKRNVPGGTYRMAGIPDGLGAYDNGNGTFTLLMNHELRNTQGVTRAHGAIGAFVSRWQIRKRDLAVLNGEDLMKTVKVWNAASGTYGDGSNVVFSRFCSADLAAPSAFYDSDSDLGYGEGRIYLNGEEDGSFGRAVAHLSGGPQDGTSYVLPRFAVHAWENLLASPYEQEKTIVIGNEDGAPNRVYVYVGDKQDSGTPVDKAGLNNGVLHELKIPGYTNDDPVAGFRSGTFQLVGAGGTTLDRPEDGQWDPKHPDRYWFVTTASITGNCRLWRMDFTDIRHPELGGKIEVAIDGNLVPDPQIKMMDNMTVDQDGMVYLQEDVGNNVRLGRLWKYNPKNGDITELAQHDPTRFIAGAGADIDGTGTSQSDEESSGIIDVTFLFKGVEGYDVNKFRYLIFDVQAHYTGVSGTALASELVEGGQLLLMKVPAHGNANPKD